MENEVTGTLRGEPSRTSESEDRAQYKSSTLDMHDADYVGGRCVYGTNGQEKQQTRVHLIIPISSAEILPKEMKDRKSNVQMWME